MSRKRILFASALVLLPACSGVDSEPDPEGDPTYYTDVKPILDGRCVSCHSQGNIGPFVLDTYEAAHATRELIAASAADRTMPPWSADPGHADYRFDPSLTDDQIAVLQKWVDTGAAEGDPATEGEPLPVVSQKLSRVDLTLKMPQAYVPVTTPDEYRCFLLDWPETDTMYVTGVDAKPGATAIDHHIVMFLVRPDNPLGEGVFDSLAQLDAEDPAPGYECFGGPAGESGLQIPAQQLGQWVPGQGGGDFPAGSGIKVPPGSKVVLQMHYSLGMGEVPEDLTTIDLKLDKTVEREAAFAPWLDQAWPSGTMVIPAGEADVMHMKSADPRGFFNLFIGDVDVKEGFVLHATMLHMHKLGKSAVVRREAADGTTQTLLSISNWDFNWQRLYQLEEPVRFMPGDKMTVECHWDNSQENQPVVDGVKQPPKEVNWGEGTGEEMCVANNYIVEP